MPENEINACYISKAAKLVGDIWILLIVKQLLEHSQRFCELQNLLSEPGKNSKISSKTLAQRLKLLETEGVVNRQVFVDIPVKVEYSLTPKGRALSKIIGVLKEFGENYIQ